jgi:hypothetical protein
MVSAADRMPMLIIHMPLQPGAPLDVTVVLAPPHADAAEAKTTEPDPAPKLVAVAVQRI